jgi:hypothetical protein
MALLSINTATSPKFQGRGIFKVLAENTYKFASESHFSAVIGVANGNSFKAFVRHLGFENLGNLDLRFGFLSRSVSGSRVYSNADIAWRCASKRYKFKQSAFSSDKVNISVGIFPGLKISSVFPTTFSATNKGLSRKIGLTLDWRRGKKPLFFLPGRLKPSPLALIYKSLDGTPSSILTSWSFPDFDAY